MLVIDTLFSCLNLYRFIYSQTPQIVEMRKSPQFEIAYVLCLYFDSNVGRQFPCKQELINYCRGIEILVLVYILLFFLSNTTIM